MTHPNPHLAYRPDIDGLRALAVLSVVIFHAYPSVLPGGFVGVDVFFVISGYLITSIVVKALGQGAFSFADFYARRLRRILPALLTVVATCLALGGGSLFPDEYAQLAKHSAAGLGFVANVVFWQETGYFDTEAELKPLLHLWSLGVEEQFYIFWPALALVLWRVRRRLGGPTLALAALSLALSVALSARYPSASYFLPSTRAWELLSGALLAWRLQTRGLPPVLRGRWAATCASSGGMLLILGGLLVIDKSKAFPGAWALLPVCGSVLVIVAGPAGLFNRALSWRPMVWLGAISYPLYLWHWPLLSFTRIVRGDGANDRVVAGVLVLAVFLAWATYRFVETPVRRREGFRPVAALAVLAMLVAGVAVNLHLRDGLEMRLKDAQAQQESMDLRWEDDRFARADCLHLLPADFTGDCLIGDSSRTPDAMIIGDSHANHYFWGISESLLGHRTNLLQVSRDGCLLLFRLDTVERSGESRGCAPVARAAYEYALKTPEVKTVFLAGRWVLGITARQLKDKPGVFSRAHRRPVLLGTSGEIGRGEAIAIALDETLAALTRAGKRVVFLDSVPELAFNARECVSWTPNRFVSRVPRPDCEVPRGLIEARNGEYRHHLQPVLSKHPAVIVFDPQSVMCDKRACSGRREGRLMYRDDDHLSLEGSRWIGRHIVRSVVERSRADPGGPVVAAGHRL